MANEFILMLHPAFGILGVLATLWVLVDSLNASPANLCRLRWFSRAAAVLIWLSYLLGGYWYVVHYGVDKAVIKAGPWPFAHGFFMETKEHVFLVLLLLSTYLPLVASNDLVGSVASRRLVVLCAGLVVLLGLAMEGSGAMIAMGVKVGLLAP